MSNIISHAGMAELVDALDSKSSAARRAGSIPAPGTTIVLNHFKPIARTEKTSRFRAAFISSIAIQLKKT
jgi:hypothetical protein